MGNSRIEANPPSRYLNNAADFDTTCATPHNAGISTTNQLSATFIFSAIGRLPVMRGINRPHESVRDETDHQQRRHEVHRHRVRARFRYSMRDLVLADVIHQYRPRDTSD